MSTHQKIDNRLKIQKRLTEFSNRKMSRLSKVDDLITKLEEKESEIENLRLKVKSLEQTNNYKNQISETKNNETKNNETKNNETKNNETDKILQSLEKRKIVDNKIIENNIVDNKIVDKKIVDNKNGRKKIELRKREPIKTFFVEKTKEIVTRPKIEINKELLTWSGQCCPVPQIEAIYCINLESCKERRNNMKREFKKNNWNAVFTKAISPRHPEHRKKYGQPKFVDQSWNTPRCYCPEKCEHRTRKLRPTEVAICLSHNHVYHNIVKRKHKWTLVCEDDLVFVENFCDILKKCIPDSLWQGTTEVIAGNESIDHPLIELQDDKCIPDESTGKLPIIIFLGGARDNPGLKINDPSVFKLFRMRRGNYSNYCYLLNYEAAKFLNRKLYPITRPDDSFKRYWISKGRILCYKLGPSLVAELSAGTNMDAVYNRWSLQKAPPSTKALPEKEYKKKEEKTINSKKTKRLITYNKFRHHHKKHKK